MRTKFKDILTESHWFHGSGNKLVHFDKPMTGVFPTFMTKDKKIAKMYGKHIHHIQAKPGKTLDADYNKITGSSLKRVSKQYRYVRYKTSEHIVDDDKGVTHRRKTRSHNLISLYPHEDLKIKKVE